MYNIKIWWTSFALQVAITLVCLASEKWTGMIGGIFGMFMVLIYMDALKKLNKLKADQ